MYGAVLADDVVGADLGAGYGKGLQGLGTAVLSGVVDDDKIGFAQVEVDRSCPIGGHRHRVRTGGQRVLADDPAILPGLSFIFLIGGFIRVEFASGQQEQKDRASGEILHNYKIGSKSGPKI